jgi:glutamate--cysteine ligase
LHALRERGVEYVEVRCMDLDPFVPVGIGPQTMRFLDVFLLHCLLAESPPDTPEEIAALARNQERVAARGREPGLRLERGGTETSLTEWGEQVLDECAPIATALDTAHGGTEYRDALAAALAALRAADATPSAHVLNSMAKHFDNSYVRFIQAQSEQTKNTLLRRPLPSAIEARFRNLAQESIEAQQRLEAADTMPFEGYRETYLSTERLGIQSNSKE